MPTMTYVGHAMLSAGDSSERLAEEAVRLAGLPPDTAIDLYEQVTFDLGFVGWNTVVKGACVSNEAFLSYSLTSSDTPPVTLRNL